MFELPMEALRAAVSDRTRAIVVNTPHNPTGRVFSRKELECIAELCLRHDILAITDEVYEDLVYEGEHISLASLPGMWERTVTLSSLGKSFSLTGWKIGWSIAPPDLTAGIRAAHQFLTFATATPLQHAAAAGLEFEQSYYQSLQADYRRKRDMLADGLREVGFDVFLPASGFFIIADHTRLSRDRIRQDPSNHSNAKVDSADESNDAIGATGATKIADDVAFARWLIKEVGVAAIPPGSFYSNPEDGRAMIRFAFCKDEQTLQEAVDRLKRGLAR